MSLPRRRFVAPALGLVLLALLLATAPLWLPLPGLLLVEADDLAPADVGLVLEGMGPRAMDVAEEWRQQGLVRDVVIVEARLRSQAMYAYWSDFVAWGLARPSPTPAEHLRVVRAPNTAPAVQADAALPAVQALGGRSMLVPGGGLGSRLQRRELEAIFGPAGITVRLAPPVVAARDAARWYEHPDDRRFVLAFWIQLLVPGAAERPSGTSD